MSNVLELLQALDKRCFCKYGFCSRPRGGRHAECLGKTAQRAATFQEELRLAILRGFRNQLLRDRRMRKGEVGTVDSAEGVMIDGHEDIEA